MQARAEVEAQAAAQVGRAQEREDQRRGDPHHAHIVASFCCFGECARNQRRACRQQGRGHQEQEQRAACFAQHGGQLVAGNRAEGAASEQPRRCPTKRCTRCIHAIGGSALAHAVQAPRDIRTGLQGELAEVHSQRLGAHARQHEEQHTHGEVRRKGRQIRRRHRARPRQARRQQGVQHRMIAQGGQARSHDRCVATAEDQPHEKQAEHHAKGDGHKAQGQLAQLGQPAILRIPRQDRCCLAEHRDRQQSQARTEEAVGTIAHTLRASETKECSAEE